MATSKKSSTRTKSTSSDKKTARKQAPRKKRSPGERPPMLKEPVAARVMQAAILLAAILLLFSAIFSPSIGPVLVGLLVLFTGFPPIRGPIDEWLTGKRRGKEAERAAAIRMAAGAAVILFTLLNAVARL